MQAQYETKLIYRRLDENGDYVWGNSMNDMLSGQDAMRQVIQTRLWAFQGEWWEGDRTALPYFGEMLEAPGSMSQIRKIDLMVIARLMDTVGVLNVTDFQSTYKNREYKCSCKVHTVYGDIFFDERSMDNTPIVLPNYNPDMDDFRFPGAITDVSYTDERYAVEVT